MKITFELQILSFSIDPKSERRLKKYAKKYMYGHWKDIKEILTKRKDLCIKEYGESRYYRWIPFVRIAFTDKHGSQMVINWKENVTEEKKEYDRYDDDDQCTAV